MIIKKDEIIKELNSIRQELSTVCSDLEVLDNNITYDDQQFYDDISDCLFTVNLSQKRLHKAWRDYVRYMNQQLNERINNGT